MRRRDLKACARSTHFACLPHLQRIIGIACINSCSRCTDSCGCELLLIANRTQATQHTCAESIRQWVQDLLEVLLTFQCATARNHPRCGRQIWPRRDREFL